MTHSPCPLPYSYGPASLDPPIGPVNDHQSTTSDQHPCHGTSLKKIATSKQRWMMLLSSCFIFGSLLLVHSFRTQNYVAFRAGSRCGPLNPDYSVSSSEITLRTGALKKQLGYCKYLETAKIDSSLCLADDSYSKEIDSFRFLSPLDRGSMLQIEIGDPALARKAWKKRRRNESPLLVPCNLHSLDARSCLQQNIAYLVKKFGSPTLSLAQLSQRFRSHFRSQLSLKTTAQELIGDEIHSSTLDGEDMSLLDLLKGLFPPGNKFGINIRQSDTGEKWFLQREQLSVAKARRQAAATAIVQFVKGAEVLEDSRSLLHTGLVRSKDMSGSYTMQPLSAALRIPQHQLSDVVSLFENDQSVKTPAYVWDFDPQGDAGSPLLVLSLNPPPQHTRFPRQSQWGANRSYNDAGNDTQLFVTDLSVGDTITGTVVQFVKGAALVDVNVCRVKENGAEYPVLGRLPFKEAFAAMAETYTTRTDDMADLLVTSGSNLLDDELVEDRSHTVRQRLNVGDRVPVYVMSVSKRSAQIVLTMNSRRCRAPSSNPKKDSTILKKLSRLEKQLGGFDKLHNLRGQEFDGIVQATSKRYLYVQPDSSEQLPVGIAACDSENSGLEKGDCVRVQIDGVDRERGQLALTVLRKLP